MASTVRDLDNSPNALWDAHRQACADGDLQRIIATRNALVTYYLPLVRQIAVRLAGRLPAHVGPGDLASQGVFGLIDAIDRFDDSRNIAFTTFARHKINSAMLDYLRSIDVVTRLQRRRLRMIDKAKQNVMQRTGHPADEQQLAALCGLTVAQVRRAQRDGIAATTVPMSRLEGDPDANDGPQRSIADALADPRAVQPEDDAARRNLRHHLVRDLSRAERLIVILYYYEGLSMREIGRTLDLSESRVSQMHSLILERLRARFADNERLLRDLIHRRSA